MAKTMDTSSNPMEPFAEEVQISLAVAGPDETVRGSCPLSSSDAGAESSTWDVYPARGVQLTTVDRQSTRSQRRSAPATGRCLRKTA